MKRNLWTLIVFVLVASLVFTGCTSSSEEETTAGNEETTTTVEKEPVREDLNIAIDSVLTNLDPTAYFGPQQLTVHKSIFESLINLDSEFNPIPGIAETWEVSADGLTHTFKLFKDITFSNGEALTADDVVYTVERFYKSPMGGYYSIFLGTVAKVDDYTVMFTTPAVYEGIYSALSNLSILPQEYMLSINEDLSTTAIGSGPYMVKEFVSGSNVVLEKNPTYHGTPANIQNVNIKFIAEASTRVISLESGEVDLIIAAPVEDRDYLLEQENLVLDEVPAVARFILAMNQYGTLSNPKIREAIAAGIDNNEIFIAMTNGAGILNKGMLAASGNKDYANLVDMTTYDVERAKQLISETNYNPEKDIITLSVLDPISGKIAEIVQGQLAKVNIKIQIEMIEPGTYYQRIAEKKIDMAISLGGSSDFGAQEDIGSLTTAQDPMDRFMDSAKIDELYSKLVITSDLEQRKQIVKEAYEEIKLLFAAVPLYSPNTNVVYHKDLKGVQVSATNVYQIGNFSWE